MADPLWIHTCYPSGTQVVSRMEIATKAKLPHLYVYGPALDNEDDRNEARANMCVQLRDFLNGDAKWPRWIGDMQRVGEFCIEGSDGSRIFAVGPSFESEPGKGDWKADNSQEAIDAKARLIDRITLTGED